jgi:hypothetical protein
MGTLEAKMLESINQFSEKFDECVKLKEFEKTSRQFNLLVKKGIIEKRGNNLLSISDKNLKNHIVFNKN